MSAGLFPPRPAPEELGRPSRKAAKAAIEAHKAVLEGEPVRAAISNALERAGTLGGKERRFAALAARELSRHQRLLDLCGRALGCLPSTLTSKGDRQSIDRRALRRSVRTRRAGRR